MIMMMGWWWRRNDGGMDGDGRGRIRG